jgi:hypothetical protein
VENKFSKAIACFLQGLLFFGGMLKKKAKKWHLQWDSTRRMAPQSASFSERNPP